MHGDLVGVGHFPSFLAGRAFTLITDCSALLTWLFRSRELDPKLYRWALRLIDFDMTLQWRVGTFHQIPDAISRLLRPGLAGETIDDSFSDDSTSKLPNDYIGPQGLRFNGALLKDLETLREGDVDPESVGEIRVRARVDPEPTTTPVTLVPVAAVVDSTVEPGSVQAELDNKTRSPEYIDCVALGSMPWSCDS